MEITWTEDATITGKSSISDHIEFNKHELEENCYCQSFFNVIKKYSMLTNEEQCALAKEIALGNKVARDEMIRCNLRLVIAVAMREFKNLSGLTYEELVMDGVEGLIYAVDRFDWTRGTTFSSYAYKCVQGKMLDAIYSRLHITRHMYGRVKNLRKTENDLQIELGRVPSDQEIAGRLKTTIKKVVEWRAYGEMINIYSLDQPTKNDEEGHAMIDSLAVDSVESGAIAKGKNTNLKAPWTFLRVFANDLDIFSKVWSKTKSIIDKQCQSISKYNFENKYAIGECSILLSHPIVNRLNIFNLDQGELNFANAIKKYANDKFKDCGPSSLMAYIIEMYYEYYKERKDVKHVTGGEIALEQREKIRSEFPNSALLTEIESAKTWGEISVFSIFECSIVRTKKDGKIKPYSFFNNLEIFPASKDLFPYDAKTIKCIDDWINETHSPQNNPDSEELINDLISALVCKRYIDRDFNDDPGFKKFLDKISNLKSALLRRKDPTALYLRNIDDVCFIYCAANGYPKIEQPSLRNDLIKLKDEKSNSERYYEDAIVKIQDNRKHWKNMTQKVSNDLRQILSVNPQNQKEQLKTYVTLNPLIFHVTRYNSIHKAIRSHFDAKGIYNFIHQCAESLKFKFMQAISDHSKHIVPDYTRMTVNKSLEAWLIDNFFISLKEINDEKEREKFEREQFRTYLGYDSNSMRYVRNIIIATLFESKEKITKKEINQALSEMGFVHLNPLASTFDAIISQAIDLSLQPRIVDEIRRDVLGEAVDIF